MVTTTTNVLVHNNLKSTANNIQVGLYNKVEDKDVLQKVEILHPGEGMRFEINANTKLTIEEM